MHQRKSKKILIYFFLLFLIGSINNHQLNNVSFYKINNIEVIGLNEKENNDIFRKIQNLDSKNIFFIDKDNYKDVLNSNPLVESYYVKKKYPSSIRIETQKTEFLAIINYNGKLNLIGSNGKLLEQSYSSKILPYIFGSPKIDDFLVFYRKLNESKISYNEIRKLFFFPSKRWDIELKNKVLIKLPKENNIKLLNQVYDLLNEDQFKKINILDARIKNQIIINE